MKASKFKTFMLAVCCFVIALCSEIRCMDTTSEESNKIFSSSSGVNRLDQEFNEPLIMKIQESQNTSDYHFSLSFIDKSVSLMKQ